jgi:hypothetical protein
VSGADRDGLRAMVREVIREALAERAPGAEVVEPVRVTTDGELEAFVGRLAALMRDQAAAARIASGRHRFTLAAEAEPPARASGPSRAGLVSEKAVDALPEGSTLLLAADAVVTPLARDRARARRIKLERVRRC